MRKAARRAVKRPPPAKVREPLPRVGVSLQFRPDQTLDTVRDCIVVALGTKLAEFFPDLIRYKETVSEAASDTVPAVAGWLGG